MRRSRILVVVCLAVGLLAALWTPAQALKKGNHYLDDLQMSASQVYVQPLLMPVDAVRQDAILAAEPGIIPLFEGWDRFLSDNGTSWTGYVERRTGAFASIEGQGIPWVPGQGNTLRRADIRELLGANGNVSRQTLVRQARAFLDRYPELLNVSNQELALNEGATSHPADYLWFVQFDRTYAGLPVEKSYVVFRVNHGNLVQFGGEFLGPIALDTTPYVSVETAREILAGFVGGFEDGDEWVNDGTLSILPAAPVSDEGVFNGKPGDGVAWKLVYTLAFRRPGVMGTWQAKIDAHSGEILLFEDANAYGSVTGGIYPNSPLDVEVIRPFSNLTITNGTTKYTDLGGNYAFTTGTATAALTGKYVKVTDSCGTSSLSTSTAPGDLAWSKSTGTDCTTPGVGGAGNTHAARSTYYHLTNWKVKAQGWLPSNTWLQAQLTDKVNLNQTCNAYWDGSAVNFFKSGGGCANTGELPTVFLHEAGHGLDTNDGNGFSPDKGTGETYGDSVAFLMTHDSCIGTGFFTDGSKCSGYGDACTSCTGIRDVDYAKHVSATPHTPLNFIKTKCPTSSTYKGPCGKEGHCEGYIGGEAIWDLAARDLPAAGFDSATSWQIADRLFYLTRSTAGAAFYCNTSTFASDGCGTSHYFTVFRVVDDEDGNLSNGTPHAAAIYAAFNRHAIGCSSVVNTNSSSCPTLAQPVLTATAGSGSVALSWGAVTNASTYYVMRNEMSSTAGFTIISKPTTNSYTDTAVASGITYYYTIQAVGSTTSCFSALATVKSATPSAGATYSISGTVSGATASGVTMSLTGASTATTTTDTSGNYTFSGLANGSYTVTPSKTGYTFSPTSIAVTISGANQTGKNFTATAVPTYSISGTVSGATASGVTMSLTGASTATTTTDTSGNYTFSGLANGSYTVTPSKSGYTFSPTSIAVTISGANQTGKNFTATAVAGDTPLTSGVAVNGSVAYQAYVHYDIAVPTGATSLVVTLTNLSADVDLYTGSPTLGNPTTSSYTGRSWNGGTTSETLTHTSPAAGTWNIAAYGYAAGSYTVTATVNMPTATYSISGTVSGATASGVTMSLTGAATATATTDTSGNYTFTGLANGSYTVTPSKAGYTFSPTSIAVTISGANQTGKNFTATAVAGDTVLTSGVAVSGSVALQAYMHYDIAVPAGATELKVELYNLTADIDLYTGSPTLGNPTSSSYTGSSTNSSTTSELITHASPATGTWNIAVYGYAAGNYTVKATVTTSTGTTTLFTDGWESSTGWAQVDTSGTAGTWSRVTSGTYPTCSRHGGSYMAKFNSYTAASGSATRYYRTTGFAIATSYTTVTLKFWMYHDTGYSTYADKIQPQVSTNGTTWVNVGSAINRYDGSTGWKQHSVDITSYKGQTSLRVAFLGTSAYGNNMYLDDITVVAQ